MKGELNNNIPAEIQQKVIESGADERIFEPVYRVAKRGKLDRDAFVSTYEEIISRQIPDDDVKYPKDKVGTYATSVYTDIAPCRKFIHCLKRSVRLRKEYPFPIIIQGRTSYGLTQKTCEREENYPDKLHVDWWIYSGMQECVVKDYKVVEVG